MKPYDAILFDFDGVLMDSEPIHFDCWREVLEPLGVPLEWDVFHERCIGVADYEMLQFLGSRATPPVPADRLWREFPRKNELFRNRVLADPPVPNRTRELLAELHRHYRLGLVSSSAGAEIQPVLEAAALAPLFDTVVCGDDVSRYKPDPEPYRLAAERLGIRTALVVEDSEAGLASGRAAGFDVLHITDADQTAERVREKLAAVGGLSRRWRAGRGGRSRRKRTGPA